MRSNGELRGHGHCHLIRHPADPPTNQSAKMFEQAFTQPATNQRTINKLTNLEKSQTSHATHQPTRQPASQPASCLPHPGRDPRRWRAARAQTSQPTNQPIQSARKLHSWFLIGSLAGWPLICAWHDRTSQALDQEPIEV